MKIKPRKCKLFRKEVLYIGHKISDAGVEPDAEKIRVVVEWPAPSTLKELLSFLGFVISIRSFSRGQQK